MRIVTVATAALAAIVLLPMPAGPALAHDIIRAETEPLDAEIAFNQEILREIDRQAQARVQYISGWIEFWGKVKERATETATDIKEDFDERLTKAEKAQGLLASLYVENSEQYRNVPHYGAQNARTMANLIATIRNEKAAWEELLSKEKAEYFIGGVGWVTGQIIQGVIDQKNAEIQAINRGVADGTWEVHFGGIGWVTGRQLRGAIAALEERKAAVLKQIADGDYSVMIPGIGPRTRKEIDGQIAAAEAEVVRRREIVAAGTMALNHPAIGWMNLNELRASLEEGQKAYDAMKVAVGDGVYTTYVIEYGWAKRIDLEGKVESLEATLANLQEALGKEELKEETPIGWVSAKEARAAIEQAEKAANDPYASAENRENARKYLEKAQKALGEIKDASAYDILIYAMEKAEVSGIVTGFMKFAKVDFWQRERVRADKEAIVADYPAQGALWIRQAERQVERLKKAKADWIPG